MGYFQFLRKLAQSQESSSLASNFRRRRWAIFQDIIESLQGPIEILDVGGTTSFWENHHLNNKSKVKITILNLSPQSIPQNNISFIEGDARNMKDFKDKTFDIVFSNLVIEHVGTLENQKKMADEIMRVGKKYFVQTPNYFFPMEPHFLFPFFQFLPLSVRSWLVSIFKFGYEKVHDYDSAFTLVSRITLLKKKDLRMLFPKAKIVNEKFMGLTKSFMVIG